MERYEQILSFWFGEPGAPPLQNQAVWFKKDPAFDKQIRDSFEDDLQRAIRGELDGWRVRARSCLAFIVLLDQMSRNMYRDTPGAFAQDALALEACLAGRAAGLDCELPHMQRSFFYMPMMHAEDLEVQREAVKLFDGLAKSAPPGLEQALQQGADFERRHHDIIERFGRYPHRNKILGRTSTPEEEAFLLGPGSSF
ncbi:MAG: DUF924 domain-containing protein [Deltaproteobacteria bacterium]|nr:DUF924 domain-containing protein [Deltaproteobacteria bacterium]